MKTIIRLSQVNAHDFQELLILTHFSKFYIRPQLDGKVEFVFSALSDYQEKLLSHLLREYTPYLVTLEN
ncbi:hypothetical protein ACI7RC_08400 [Brevibacillus sp. B_LB10_24]|uniref:hypothetical protein n=1 Tax=Brevibacillus sp. B_LB10_24 TaxID=3380645 RepID=UPI0038BAF5BD